MSWNLAEWLKELGLERHLSVFQEHGMITAEIVATLTNDDLKNDLGITSLGERKIILQSLPKTGASSSHSAVAGALSPRALPPPPATRGKQPPGGRGLPTTPARTSSCSSLASSSISPPNKFAEESPTSSPSQHKQSLSTKEKEHELHESDEDHHSSSVSSHSASHSSPHSSPHSSASHSGKKTTLAEDTDHVMKKGSGGFRKGLTQVTQGKVKLRKGERSWSPVASFFQIFPVPGYHQPANGTSQQTKKTDE